MHNRRRYSRRKYQKRSKTNVNFIPVIALLCLSVGCGYAAAKYVVEPVVNYVPQLTAENKLTEDVSSDMDENKITGYALQFGCYSGQSAAESVLPTIGVSGLEVIEQNDMYKIVGEVYNTKEEAKTALGDLPPTVKAFVTPIYE